MIDREMKNKKIDSYGTITLMAIDPRNPDAGIQELYPSTRIEGIFIDKELKIPVTDIMGQVEATPEEIAKLRVKTLEKSLIVLDQNGWIPLEYMDRTYLAIYYEFENTADMLNNCTYDPVKDHGRLVLVKDNQFDPGTDVDYGIPYWAIFRLCGDNVHDRASWEKVWEGIHTEIEYSFDRIPNGVRSTARMIDDMVRAAHAHADKSALDMFDRDADGNLTWNGRKVQLRKDFNSHLVIRDLSNLLNGDIGIFVITTAPYGEYDGSYVTVCGEDASGQFENSNIKKVPKLNTSATLIFNRFFKNCDKLIEIEWFNTSLAKSIDEFCAGCDNLEKISTFDFSNVESAQGAFSNCPKLETIPNLNFLDCTNIVDCFRGSGMTSIGTIEGNNITQAFSAFEDCANLLNVPNIDLSKVNSFLRIFKGCSSLEEVNVDTSAMLVALEAFCGCTNLKRVLNLDMSNCQETTRMFYGCPNLEDVQIVPGTLTCSISFAGTNLSIESGNAILENLPQIEVPATITFTDSPASRVDSVLVAKAVEKGWNIIR